MNKDSRIYIAGHNGLVGSSLTRLLKSKGYTNLVGRTSSELDLTDRSKVDKFFEECQPEYVFDAAAKVGGIKANDVYSGEFIYQNLQIQNNIIDACYRYHVKKLCFLGSVCIYPKFAEVPVKEESLLTGELEESNQWYAIAKIAGIKMCQAYNKQYGSNFISVMPTNLFGVNDNFHPENSHVIPALIRRFVEAKRDKVESVTCWGSGNARREFLYVDDMTDALEFLMLNYDDPSIINIGCNIDYTIKGTAERVAHLVGYEGEIKWDTTKPDGTPKRMMDSTKLFDMGWRPKFNLEEGLTKTIDWYRSERE
jgi:GDP-L-fucose synthase